MILESKQWKLTKNQLKTTMILVAWKNRLVLFLFFFFFSALLFGHHVLDCIIFLIYIFHWLQIQELVEAIVLPMTHKERFQKLGIRPPKGVLLYGPPGTGKTLMARACAAQTNATFLKLAGPQLVQVMNFRVLSLML